MLYPGHSLGESYSAAEMQLVYSTAPADWATRWGNLTRPTLCRDAVGVFYSPSRLGHSLGESYPLQRCSWCILQPQPTGPLVGGILPAPHSAEMQLVYSTAPTDWATRWGSLTPCRDAVGVFYNPS